MNLYTNACCVYHAKLVIGHDLRIRVGFDSKVYFPRQNGSVPFGEWLRVAVLFAPARN
jgi:hypothetical protein